MTSLAYGSSSKPLRLRPGVVLLALQWLAFLLPIAVPSVGFFGMLGALVAALAIVVWWLFFSRAPCLERVGALVLAPLAVVAVKPFVHPTIALAGMGNMLYFFSIPLLCLALVAWAAATRRLSAGPRRARSSMTAASAAVSVAPLAPMRSSRV